MHTPPTNPEMPNALVTSFGMLSEATCKEQGDFINWVSIPLHTPENPEAVEVVRYDKFVQQLLKADTEPMMALHSALGVAGEAGELADAIKKEYIYKKARDIENIIEELGDLEFYMQTVRLHYKLSRELTLQANAEKLAKRYKGLKYSDEAAINRADKSE